MAWPGSLGPESWDALFDFLDPGRRAAGPDRDREAEHRCAEILRKLACFFASRRCANPEDLALETILRVASKCRDIDVSSYADRVGYFYGVARNVIHEVQRSGQRESRAYKSFAQEFPGIALPDPDAWTRAETARSCLERCLDTLPAQAKQLILRYHSNEGAAKVTAHRALAEEIGKSVNALRIEAHRIRRTLQQCVFSCLRAAVDGPQAGPSWSRTVD
jgi:RNA polymerase sigma factor (sigma-70 family)